MLAALENPYHPFGEATSVGHVHLRPAEQFARGLHLLRRERRVTHRWQGKTLTSASSARKCVVLPSSKAAMNHPGTFVQPPARGAPNPGARERRGIAPWSFRALSGRTPAHPRFWQSNTGRRGRRIGGAEGGYPPSCLRRDGP